jgi:hypothetical protein
MPPFTPGRRARTSALPTALALAALGASPTLRAQAVATPPSSAPVPASSRATPASAKRPLAQADYDQWRTATGVTLSRDGRWLAYTATPQVGDGDLIVRSTRGAQEVRVPRGFVGRPQLQPNADSGWTAPPATFSADSRVLAALVYAPRAEFEGARRERRKPEQQPKATLAVVSLADGQVRRVPRVKSFAMPREAGGWLAYLLEPAEGSAPAGTADAARDTSARAAGVAAATPGGTPRPIAAPDSTAGRGRKREYGSTLVVRNLATGEETQIADVATYALADSGRWLAYTVSSRTEARDGAYLRPLGARLGDESTLLAGKGEYKALVFDRAGTAGGLRQQPRRRRAPAAALDAVPRARRCRRGGGDRRAAGARHGDGAQRPRPRLRARRVDDRLRALPRAARLDPADSLADKAVLDVWHWREPRLQPQQRVELSRERGAAWTAAYHVASGAGCARQRHAAARHAERRRPHRARPGGAAVRRGADVGRGRRRRGRARRAHRAAHDGGDARAERGDALPLRAVGDVVRRRPLERARRARRAHGRPDRPPRRRRLLAGRDVGHAERAAGVGDRGVDGGERSFLAYSRRDVWELDPEGRRPARVLTDSVGVRTGTTFRLVTLDRDARYVDAGRPVLLEAFDDRTKQSGFWRDRIGAAALPERLVMADARYVGLQKARDADVYLAGRQTVGESELVVGERPRRARAGDAAQPAAGAVPVGRRGAGALAERRRRAARRAAVPPRGVRPVASVSDGRVLLRAALRQPAPVPRAGRAQRGQPHRLRVQRLSRLPPRHPLPDRISRPELLESIVPGVQAVVARGFVDERAIGIAGQSWGGYQSAWMITRRRSSAPPSSARRWRT